jgi:hypothetical protein
MTTEIELGTVDTRFERCRVKAPALEGRLLSVIAQRGVEEPLAGVEVAGRAVLLDGFKRYRCALKLHLQRAPYCSLGTAVAPGIVRLLRTAAQPGLSLLEQAAFLDELKQGQGWSLADIATEVGRSKAWVSLRLGLLTEMSEAVREKLFTGAFPASAYLYTVRPFRRLNGVTAEQLEQFVLAVSGHHLSVREIAQLAHGFFRGPEALRQEIARGNWALALEPLPAAVPEPEAGSSWERAFLRDLEQIQQAMQRVRIQSLDPRRYSGAFAAQAHLFTEGLRNQARAFFQTLRQLHDRTRQA